VKEEDVAAADHRGKETAGKVTGLVRNRCVVVGNPAQRTSIEEINCFSVSNIERHMVVADQRQSKSGKVPRAVRDRHRRIRDPA
jgi:hypothetical protein